MQRMLSLGTLIVLGGLAWVFLNEGEPGLPAGAQNPALQNPTGQAPANSQVANQPLGGYAPQQTNPFLQQGSGGGQDAGGASPPPVFQQASTSPNYGGAGLPQMGGPTIRIASFNIQTFGKTKAANAPVMATLAEIVRQFDVVAIQEIRTQDDFHIPNFVRLVNQTGRRYDQ
ncbi:MAG: endonuclease/exonuclease/phosphatase family protein, partial [Planctomycetales bacterium]|nr:endonuclease/exonuclease/phosphatase family protein [Planctomycetales bacterium]